MPERKATFMINFEEMKREKQEAYHREAEDLYEWLFHFLERDLNMREKVRAKHMFRDLCGFQTETVLTREEELHAEHWMLFDYITVIGSRPFDLFIRSHSSELTPKMKETAGMMMLMHLAPYRVLHTSGSEHLLSPFQEEREIAVRAVGSPQQAEAGELILARVAQVGFEKTMVGPCIRIDPKHEEKVLEKLRYFEAKGRKSYHRFLKETGISFLQYRP
ncbi:hypothetical protein ACFO4L_13360 [Bacillus daqingensis]|uniref:Uncharacterized protein n=1 Tax=Bacillus daqingensis TaxID=872396 RepID=A0ABV9NYV1_9BACI